MPLTETFDLDDGKVVAGRTVLREPQTGALFDVLSVMSGRLPTEISARGKGGPSAGERCAMYGGRKDWKGTT